MSNIAMLITCYCGVSRFLPDTFEGKEDEKVTLAPCPRCGVGFQGVCKNGKIEVTE